MYACWFLVGRIEAYRQIAWEKKIQVKIKMKSDVSL